MRTFRFAALSSLALVAACTSDPTTAPSDTRDSGTVTPEAPPVEKVPLDETLTAEGLTGPVDVVRDESGIPHIYGKTVADVAYAQGFTMAADRFVQMDLARRQGSGTLSELLGGLLSATLASDVNFRAHHLRATAQKTWDDLNEKAKDPAKDPVAKKLVDTLTMFAKGVNAYLAELKSGKRTLPATMRTYYDVNSATVPSAAWTPLDSIVLGELQAFSLAFDATSDIERSTLALKEDTLFKGSADPAKAARVGFAADYDRLGGVTKTHTVDGLGGIAPIPTAKLERELQKKKAKSQLAVLGKLGPALKGIGLDQRNDPARGSNNWVIGGELSATGNPLVANDTHLALPNPSTFYLNHLTASEDKLDVMGVQFPGIPLVILGMNKNLAWGSTVSFLDVTDVYQETVKDCATGGGKCVVFKGGEVKLVAREESIPIGDHGVVQETKKITIYDVPHHGPIIPKLDINGNAAPLGTTEYSIRYTGYEGAPLIRAVYDLDTATTVKEAVKGLNASFKYGGQNWVIADATNIAWTQTACLPKRPKGAQPWRVMPGDGSAEWAGCWDVGVLPQAVNPPKKYMVTANSDPVGNTDDDDPLNDKEIDNYPLYLGSDYDPGTRISRITKRIEAATAGGKKVTADDLASIQADAVSEWGEAMGPILAAAAQALAEEAATAGTHPELSTLVSGSSAQTKALFAKVQGLVTAWSYDTPAGNPGESEKEIADSKAALVTAVWTNRFVKLALGDEMTALGETLATRKGLKLVGTIIKDPTRLKTGEILFDDMTTPETETRGLIAAKALVSALDAMIADEKIGPNPDAWRWGQKHTLTPQFSLPVGLDLAPLPRHGGIGTVDVGSHGLGDNYGFSSGPAIRFVAEVTPQGPKARNVLPGGIVFDPTSPHYRDLLDLWAKNKAVDLAYRVEDVVPRAMDEYNKNKIGRRRFAPPAK